MIVYKVDSKAGADVNSAIKDMSTVLKEAAVTYQLLLERVNEHAQVMSSPSIDQFRNQLHMLLVTTITNAQTIAENSEKLVVVSEQASKHLTAFEDHFSAALQKHAKTEVQG